MTTHNIRAGVGVIQHSHCICAEMDSYKLNNLPEIKLQLVAPPGSDVGFLFLLPHPCYSIVLPGK